MSNIERNIANLWEIRFYEIANHLKYLDVSVDAKFNRHQTKLRCPLLRRERTSALGRSDRMLERLPSPSLLVSEAVFSAPWHYLLNNYGGFRGLDHQLSPLDVKFLLAACFVVFDLLPPRQVIANSAKKGVFSGLGQNIRVPFVMETQHNVASKVFARHGLKNRSH